MKNFAKALIAAVILFFLFSIRTSKTLKPTLRPKFGIITMFSSNHLCEAIHSCRTYTSIPEIMNRTIPVINLYAPDVTENDLEKYRTNCPYVQLRPFTVSAYPEYFKDLKNYRFKFPTVANVLSQFNTIMYVDASIRFTSIKNETMTDLFTSMETDFAKKGVRLLSKNFHGNFPVTHPDMYAFFNVTKDQMKETIQLHSGLYLLNNSPEGWNVLNKLIKCSLEPKCMAPEGTQVKCNVERLKENNAVVCHRFDQSALNMRVIELYGTDKNQYYRPSPMIVIKQMRECTLEK